MGLVVSYINFAHDVLLEQGLLAIFQRFNLLFIFRALSYHRIQTDGAILTDGKNGFQLCFYGLENGLFQFQGIYLQIMAGAVLSRLRAAANKIGALI